MISKIKRTEQKNKHRGSKLVETVQKSIFRNREISNFNSIFFESRFKEDKHRLLKVVEILNKFSMENLLDICDNITRNPDSALSQLLEESLCDNFNKMRNIQ